MNQLVRYINIYPPELCDMGQEEFVHPTYEDAQRHLNPGGGTVRFLSIPDMVERNGTSDQIAVIMLTHGTDAQVAEALVYFRGNKS